MLPNVPLTDLCFRCDLLFWQVRARAETGRAERATCTTQNVFAQGIRGITDLQFVQKKAPVLPAPQHSTNICLGLRQKNGKISGGTITTVK